MLRSEAEVHVMVWGAVAEKAYKEAISSPYAQASGFTGAMLANAVFASMIAEAWADLSQNRNPFTGQPVESAYG